MTNINTLQILDIINQLISILVMLIENYGIWIFSISLLFFIIGLVIEMGRGSNNVIKNN